MSPLVRWTPLALAIPLALFPILLFPSALDPDRSTPAMAWTAASLFALAAAGFVLHALLFRGRTLAYATPWLAVLLGLDIPIILLEPTRGGAALWWVVQFGAMIAVGALKGMRSIWVAGIVGLVLAVPVALALIAS